MTIQRYPTGLLDLLGMLSTGDTPSEMAQQLGGTVDIFDLYLSDRLRIVSAGGAAAIAGTGYQGGGVQLTPPPGENWLVYGIAATSVPVTAGATLKGSMGVFRQSAGQVMLLPYTFDCIATELIVVSGVFERPQIWRPGDLLALYVGKSTGAPNVNWTGYVYYAPIKI